VDSDPYEPDVSMETANRLMYSDMSGPLSGRPDGTNANAQVANACPPAEELPNKKPIFISGVSDTRSFLAWLRASCFGGLMAQLKGEKLMVVPSNADGFRAAVSALRSLDGKDGVIFHTFTLPEDRCARLLLKNLGRGMPESVIRGEPESLNIRVQGVKYVCSLLSYVGLQLLFVHIQWLLLVGFCYGFCGEEKNQRITADAGKCVWVGDLCDEV